MVSKIVFRLFIEFPFPSVLLNFILHLHNFCYKLAGPLATKLEKGKNHPKHRIIYYKEWFIERINHGDVVLDVGCNTGAMVELLSQQASFVYGIDINQNYIDTAKRIQKRKNVKFIHADATRFDFKSCGSIDVVTLSNVLEHIENRVDFLKTLIDSVNWKEPSRNRFLIRVPMIDRDWITILKKERGIEYRLDSTHYIEYTLPEFEEELRMAGIKISNHSVSFGELYADCAALPSLRGTRYE